MPDRRFLSHTLPARQLGRALGFGVALYAAALTACRPHGSTTGTYELAMIGAETSHVTGRVDAGGTSPLVAYASEEYTISLEFPPRDSTFRSSRTGHGAVSFSAATLPVTDTYAIRTTGRGERTGQTGQPVVIATYYPTNSMSATWRGVEGTLRVRRKSRWTRGMIGIFTVRFAGPDSAAVKDTIVMTGRFETR